MQALIYKSERKKREYGKYKSNIQPLSILDQDKHFLFLFFARDQDKNNHRRYVGSSVSFNF